MTISKHLKASKKKSGSRRGSSHARSLIAYLRKGDQRSHVAFVRFHGFNIASDQEKDIDIATLEMMALADANPRCANPLLHAMVSWPEGERPTEVQAQEAVAIVLTELGAQGLQHIYAAHVDTNNFHLHIVVNRLDPQTERPRRLNNGFHQEALLRASARIDAVHGWSRPKNAIYDVTDKGVAVRRDAPRRHNPARPSIAAGVRDQEIKTGTKSATRVAQDDVADAMVSAKSWQQLHADLAALGVRYERKGSGAILWLDDQPVKASAISRKAALGEMQKCLGEYEPPAALPGHAAPSQRRPAPPRVQSINNIAAALGWSAYRQEREKFFTEKRNASARLAGQFAAERQQLFERQAAERREISRRDWRGHGALLNALRHRLASEHAKTKAALMARQKAQRSKARLGQFPSFEEWVDQKHGRPAADIYRHPTRLILITGPQDEPGPAGDIRDYRAQAVGSTVRYFDRAGRTAFIDTGPRIAVIDRSEEGTLAALQLAQMRYGARLTLRGPPDWLDQVIRIAVREGITIANPELQVAIAAERQRQAAARRMAWAGQRQIKAEPQQQPESAPVPPEAEPQEPEPQPEPAAIPAEPEPKHGKGPKIKRRLGR